MVSIFKSWSDADFYSKKARHIYFYGGVSRENVQTLRSQLHEACKSIVTPEGTQVKPRPIVIHVHSPGGDAHLGIAIANFMRQVTVPYAIVVEGYACSAITPMLVTAPFRVMHDFSFTMFHEPSVFMFGVFKNTEIKENMAGIQRISSEYLRIYETNTRVPKDILIEMLSRDIFMDAQTCKKYDVVDRVFMVSKQESFKAWDRYMAKNKEFKISREPSSWGTMFNHLYNYNNANCDSLFASFDTRAKSLVDLIQPMHAIMMDSFDNTPTPIVIHTNFYLTPSPYLFDIATIIAHMSNVKVPVIGVIDSTVDLMKALPCIMAYKRYMYENAYITVSFLYSHESLPHTYYDDIKHNTNLVRSAIQRVLKQYTKVPDSFIKTLFDKRITLTAQDCKKYGLVDEIIPTPSRKRVQGGGSPCACSQGLPY